MVMRKYCLVMLVVLAVAAQDTGHRPKENQIAGPRDAGDYDSWLRDLKIWRAERLTRMGYSDAEYRRPELQWAQRDFVQPQMMCEERYFYDPVQRRYTVDRYLDDLEKRYGGIDSVLIWPVYPNIGIDNRNEWDLHRDLPGGIPALREDGGRFSQPRGARFISHHALGQRDARSGDAALGGYRETDGRDRRRWSERRYVQRASARISHGVRRHGASNCFSAGNARRRRMKG